MRCESCPLLFPVHIYGRETRRCHSPDKGHFRGGTLVLSRLVSSRSSRLSCAVPWSGLTYSRVDSSIVLAFSPAPQSNLNPELQLEPVSCSSCAAKVWAARYARNCSVLLRSHTLRFSQKPLTLGLKVVGYSLSASPKPNGRDL